MNEGQYAEPSTDRTCDVCREPMKLLTTLPRTAMFKMQRVYKCEACGLTLAITVP